MSWATDHAVSTTDTLTYNNKTWYPVTNWVAGSGITTGSGDTWLCAAVRFLMSSDSASGSNHILAQYTAWTSTGSVDSTNGYYLIRRLNSSITTYTGSSSTQGAFWTTLDDNQRQGLVKNGVVTANKIWYDTPYIVTDCGTLANGVEVSSKRFYVGTTETVSNVYQQTSVLGTYTTPADVSTTPYNKVIVGDTVYMDISSDTVAAGTLLSGYTAHDKNGAEIQGSIATRTLANASTTNPSYTNQQTVGRSTSTRYIKVQSGYYADNKMYTISAVANMTLPTATSSTSSGTAKLSVTPSTANKYINIPTGYNGTASYYTVEGDANLIADNIAEGVQIFGVTGTHSGGGGGVTCTARSGGGSWQNAINGSGTTVGWREEKFSDGRLTRWCWDYWNANAGDGAKTVAMTANASDGSGPTAFVGTPQFSFGFINNNTTIACNATVKSWSNSSVTYYLVFTNNTSGRRIAVSLKMEGWWQ